MKHRNHSRNSQGVGIAVISMLIGAIMIASLGLFSFEMLRHNTCFDELRSACEASALAGAAAMASSDKTATASTRALARAAAVNAFKQNSVVGNMLNTVDTSSMNANNYNTFQPAANKSAMFVEFIDPQTKQVITDDNNPNGRVVRVSAAYTNEPPFGKFLGIPAAPMRTRADSSVPQLDIVMCFDTSGSIDDQTLVTLVARGESGGKNEYKVQGSGTIYTLMKPQPIGSPLQAVPPQNLQGTSNGWTFRSDVRGGGTQNDSQPATTPSASFLPTDFTDCVVNIDGKPTFGGVTINGYSFPTVGYLVEAARGNLEGPGIAASSGALNSLPGCNPRAGYQAAYFNAALAQTQPIGDARSAALQFFQIMNNNTDAHFGFVPFASREHHLLTDNGSDWKVSRSYQPPGRQTVMQPGIELDRTTNNLTSIVTKCIPSTQAWGGTNFESALQQAVDQLKASANKSRPLAKRAIVFFTDGQPTVPQNWPPTWQNAAAQAKQEKIQIYTVGLAQNSGIIPLECDHLNAGAGQTVSYTDPETGAGGSYTPSADGMAAAGAPGGKFFLVTNGDNLRYVFENIARNLVQLVKAI